MAVTAMRFHVAAAYVMGIGLPVLELLRRGSDVSRVANYADDFLAGGLLLWAAIATSQGRRVGPVLLVMAWAMVCGGFYYSIVGQLQNPAPVDVSGLPNTVVVLIKIALCAVAIAALIVSAKRVVERLNVD
jgi:hypothetical protein